MKNLHTAKEQIQEIQELEKSPAVREAINLTMKKEKTKMDIKEYKKSYFGEKLAGIVADLENLINEMDFADPKTQDNIRSISKNKIVIHVGPDKLKTKFNYDLIGNINEYLSERKVVASSCATLINVESSVYATETNSLDITYDISNL